MTAPDPLAEARRLLAAATSGEWRVLTGDYDDLHLGNCGSAAGVDMGARNGFFVPGFRPEDAELIAAAPTLLAALCDEIERLRAQPCRYVATDGEGTSYCRLAEDEVKRLRAVAQAAADARLAWVEHDEDCEVAAQVQRNEHLALDRLAVVGRPYTCEECP